MRKIFLLVAIMLFVSPVSADRGFVLDNVSVYGPGQRAIVAWNGSEEILILSTDLWAAENTRILEFIPLPSYPIVEKANFSSFEVIQDLILEKAPPRKERAPLGIEIVFHEKLGLHDITVIKVNDVQEFITWMQGFLTKMQLEGNIYSPKLESVLKKYFENNMKYFVCDVIEIKQFVMTSEPILYDFKTDFLYYPLIVSSLASGETEIVLFALTPYKLTDLDINTTKLSIAKYYDGTPMMFKLNKTELNNIHPALGRLFDSAWLTVLNYKGPVENLDNDLILKLKFPFDPKMIVFIVMLLLAVIIVTYLFSIFILLSKKRKK